MNFIGENEFLLKYNCRELYESKNFFNSKLTWRDLMDICADYDARMEELDFTRNEFVKVIQDFKGVHSVRSRLKDREHLIEKIIRKVAKNGVRIDKDSYIDRITDLIGIRIIHISRFQSYELFEQICNKYKEKFIEKVSIKIREGDDAKLYDELVKRGATIDKVERYRSMHYIVKSDCGVCAEFQTRTLFEEGWSEVDHDSVYKPSSNNELKVVYSSILSRLAGACDDIAELMLKSNIGNEPVKTHDGKAVTNENLPQIIKNLK